jgi:hypothetical protein
MNYEEAKRAAAKPRDIWLRRLLLDRLANPLAYLLYKYGQGDAIGHTYLSFVAGVSAAVMFAIGAYLWGAIYYFLYLLSDSIDGRLNRIAGKDDT